MDHPQGVLRTGDRATVQFEFISHPEFIKVGMKLLFREGKTKVKKVPDCSVYLLTYYHRALE
jgi:GTPase